MTVSPITSNSLNCKNQEKANMSPSYGFAAIKTSCVKTVINVKLYLKA